MDKELTCSKCQAEVESPLKRYCKKCSSEYMKQWRAQKGISSKKRTGLCKCGKERAKSHRYCPDCKNAYSREWRKTHPLNEEQKFRANVRSKTKMRIQRGLLIPYPCDVCGNKKAEAHHDDYRQPYCIRWLCFEHHREFHKEQNLKKKLNPSYS